jgi:hypothetical protein
MLRPLAPGFIEPFCRGTQASSTGQQQQQQQQRTAHLLGSCLRKQVNHDLPCCDARWWSTEHPCRTCSRHKQYRVLMPGARHCLARSVDTVIANQGYAEGCQHSDCIADSTSTVSKQGQETVKVVSKQCCPHSELIAEYAQGDQQ